MGSMMKRQMVSEGLGVQSAESRTARCGDRALPLALRLSCPPQPWRRRMPLATLRLIPAPKNHHRRTASQSVAVMFGKASAFAGLPPAPGPLQRTRRRDESADAVAGWPKKAEKKSVKSVKSVFAHFSIGTCCRPICSNRNRRQGFYGFYVNFTGGYGGEGGRKKEKL